MLDLALREQLRLVQEDPYGLLERLQLIDKQGRPTLFDSPFEEQLLIMDGEAKAAFGRVIQAIGDAHV